MHFVLRYRKIKCFFLCAYITSSLPLLSMYPNNIYPDLYNIVWRITLAALRLLQPLNSPKLPLGSLSVLRLSSKNNILRLFLFIQRQGIFSLLSAYCFLDSESVLMCQISRYLDARMHRTARGMTLYVFKGKQKNPLTIYYGGGGFAITYF